MPAPAACGRLPDGEFGQRPRVLLPLDTRQLRANQLPMYRTFFHLRRSGCLYVVAVVIIIMHVVARSRCAWAILHRVCGFDLDNV
ncbi:MAG: hypothetical protein LC753_10630 [Acidobacteria bacterium]|nr:hypothetical protein [Acidobacteriota bacterium]